MAQESTTQQHAARVDRACCDPNQATGQANPWPANQHVSHSAFQASGTCEAQPARSSITLRHHLPDQRAAGPNGQGPDPRFHHA